MDRILIRLDIYAYNLKYTKSIKKKEDILNHLNELILPLRNVQSILSYMFSIDMCFKSFIFEHNLSYLMLMLFHLEDIAKYINLSDKYILTYHDNQFKIVDHPDLNDQNEPNQNEPNQNESDEFDISILNMSMQKSLSWADG
jgi:hypothetical protein